MERNHLNTSDQSSNFSLEGLKKENPFRVPDGYFDELPLRINERIDVNPVIKRYRRIHPGIFAAAASVVVLLGLVMFLRTNGIKTEFNTEASYASVSDTHIVNHLEKAILNGELDETELLDAVVDKPSKTSVSQPAAVTKEKVVVAKKVDILKTVSDDEIIDYLVQHNSPTTSTSEIWQ
jgi:hypothetical protein